MKTPDKSGFSYLNSSYTILLTRSETWSFMKEVHLRIWVACSQLYKQDVKFSLSDSSSMSLIWPRLSALGNVRVDKTVTSLHRVINFSNCDENLRMRVNADRVSFMPSSPPSLACGTNGLFLIRHYYIKLITTSKVPFDPSKVKICFNTVSCFVSSIWLMSCRDSSRSYSSWTILNEPSI